MILSSATRQVLSYLAHDKQLPAQLSKPCRPPQKRSDRSLCGHTYIYLKDKGAAGTTLIVVGNLKDQIRSASHLGVDGINRNTRFSANRWTERDPRTWEIVFSKREKYDQPCISHFEEEAKEARLKHRLNDLGRDYGLQVDNTGSHTVLKHLNDVEMKALLQIVERDAPECVESVKKFHDGTKFNYRALDGSSYYRSTTPEPVTESQLEGPEMYAYSIQPGPGPSGITTCMQYLGRGPKPYTGEGEGETVRRYVE